MRRMMGFAAIIFLTAGCSITATLVPVDGPLAQHRPLRTLPVRVDGVQGNSGKLSFVLPSGDPCTGRWVSMRASVTAVGASTLLSQYGPMYLTGFTAVQSGQNPGQALATCRDGRSFQLEFVTNAGTAHGFGIGKDTDGNLFKFVF